MLQDEFEVAVVGAGPGGLASGVTLGSYGIGALVVDRRRSASTLPRATVASTATMELLRRFGLEAKAWERSLEVEWQAWACPSLAEAERGEAVEVGLPTRAQAALVSPTAPACLAQDELEPLLEEHLRSLGSVQIERGTELVALERAREGYMLTLAAGDGVRRVNARYVVGADGVRSRVRQALGIETHGDDRLANRLTAVFRAPLWELVGTHRYGIYFLDAERSLIPAGRPDRWLFAMPWDGDGRAAAALPPAQVEHWIREAVGVPRLPMTLERALPVEFGVGVADRFRDGGAFLVGDAAHRVTPRGGTGLNAAIRDGFDIGWKLAWVIRGWAGERLLESYEGERRPIAEFNAERSARSDGSFLGTARGLNADLGGRIPHLWVTRDGGPVSTVDLLRAELTLFAAPGWEGVVPGRRQDSPPVALERLDAIAARGLGLSPAGALVARPDGVPVALDNHDVSVGVRLVGWTPEIERAA
jgi:putative polyketide hydroxylase